MPDLPRHDPDEGQFAREYAALDEHEQETALHAARVAAYTPGAAGQPSSVLVGALRVALAELDRVNDLNAD
jgi:hypothetical protein